MVVLFLLEFRPKVFKFPVVSKAAKQNEHMCKVCLKSYVINMYIKS